MAAKGKRRRGSPSAADCSSAARELASRGTSRAGRKLSACVGGSCSSAGWRLRVIGSSQAGRSLRRCGPLGRRSNPPPRQLSAVAADVRRHWQAPYYRALPFIEAMANMRALSDRYGGDDGVAVVSGFLETSGSWSGPDADRVKGELRAMLGVPVPRSPCAGDPCCPMCGGQAREAGALGIMKLFTCDFCLHSWGHVPEVSAPAAKRPRAKARAGEPKAARKRPPKAGGA